MNQQEEMRIAIAEACGWSDIKQGLYDGSPFGRHKTHQLLPLPDFCNDLNAMHEAEKVLDQCIGTKESPRYTYAGHLYEIVPDYQQPCRATATQRSEAFCRTLKIGPFKEQSK